MTAKTVLTTSTFAIQVVVFCMLYSSGLFVTDFMKECCGAFLVSRAIAIRFPKLKILHVIVCAFLGTMQLPNVAPLIISPMTLLAESENINRATLFWMSGIELLLCYFVRKLILSFFRCNVVSNFVGIATYSDNNERIFKFVV